MGFSGVGLQELLLIGFVVLLVFGSKNIRRIGSDLGCAVRDFKREISAPSAQYEQEGCKEQLRRD
ncbi:MAG: twin-arginine translocase TatA/TatE family subunit [Shewanella sp.]